MGRYPSGSSMDSEKGLLLSDMRWKRLGATRIFRKAGIVNHVDLFINHELVVEQNVVSQRHIASAMIFEKVKLPAFRMYQAL